MKFARHRSNSFENWAVSLNLRKRTRTLSIAWWTKLRISPTTSSIR